jgi:CRISPR type III-associated protein (TIGR04423 family)
VEAMRYDSEKKLIEKLNAYLNDGYEGYVQFSGCAIDKDCIFEPNSKKEIPIDKAGFIFEAHLFRDTNSIGVKHIDKEWYIDETTIDSNEIKTYRGKLKKNIKMSQIWEAKEDEFCEGFEVLKLKKVVFAGFEAVQGGKS